MQCTNKKLMVIVGLKSEKFRSTPTQTKVTLPLTHELVLSNGVHLTVKLMIVK